MLVRCPHCAKQLKLKEGAEAGLKKLPQGKSLKVQCVHCRESFGVNAGGVVGGGQGAAVREGRREGASSGVRPPAPPDLAWLQRGEAAIQQAIAGIPRALILVPDGRMRELLAAEIEALGYQVEEGGDVGDAIRSVLHNDYELVFHHSRYEEGGLETSRFHRFLCQMPMSRRRTLFYIVAGEEMKTLYDLQALTCSANLVVNDNEISHIGALLKKTIPEYEALFGPFLEELRLAGK